MWHRVHAIAFMSALTIGTSALAEQSFVVAVVVPTFRTTAEQVEAQVSIPLERAFRALAGVQRVSSNSAEAFCRIEVSYLSTPTPNEVAQVRAAALAEWRRFRISTSEPEVTVQESQLK